MADLSYLTSQWRYWDNQANSLAQKKKKLKQRKKDVEEIISNLNKISPRNASDINGKLKQVMSNLDNGIDYSNRDAQINAIFRNKNDQALGDGNVSSAANELQRELRDTERKIDETQREYNRAAEKAKDYKTAMAVEKARQQAAAKSGGMGGR